MPHASTSGWLPRALCLGTAALLATPTAFAAELYRDADTQVTGNFLAVHGLFNSRKNYDGTSGGSSWREGFIKYGLSVERQPVWHRQSGQLRHLGRR